MNDQEVREYCNALGFGAPTFELIQTIRKNDPARNTKTGTRNRGSRLVSHKMGATRSSESGTVERAWLWIHEADPQTLEYWDQPAVPVPVSYVDRNGKRVSYPSVADAFILSETGAWYEEYKTERWLAESAESKPGAYVRRDDGRWTCPSADEFLARFGLSLVIRTDAQVPRRRLRNIEFLFDYFTDEHEPDGAAAERVVAHLREFPGTTIAELLADEAVGVSADDLYRLVASDRVYVNLDSEALGEPYRCRVFADSVMEQAWLAKANPTALVGLTANALTLALGSRLEWEGRRFTIVNRAQQVLVLQADTGELVRLADEQVERLVGEGQLNGVVAAAETSLPAPGRELLAHASQPDIDEANRRFAILRRYWRDKKVPQGQPTTALYRWQAGYRVAEKNYGWGYLGLLPKARPGNRTPRLDPRLPGLMERAYRQSYATKRAPNGKASYKVLLRLCEDAAVNPPSLRTWTGWINKHDNVSTVRAREGRKAAYQVEAPWVLTVDTPIHGDRPFHICHVDHTLLDIELISSRTLRNLGRPWLTLLIDAWSRRVLAFWLTFDPPSYRSVMSVARSCVRRHNRLAQSLFVDGGKEFRSTYSEQFAALYGMALEHRPSGAARHGSVLERLFGVTNTEFVHNLEGNTKATKRVRALTKAIDPKRLATWDIEALYEALADYFFEDYDTRTHPAIQRSPREAFDEGLRLGGSRPSTLIPYDATFEMASLPSTRKGTVRIDSSRGVKVDNVRYWAADFARPGLHLKDRPVRVDPWDIRHVFVHVPDAGWIEAHARNLWGFDAITERELVMATTEWKQANRKIRSEQDLVLALRAQSKERELEADKQAEGRRVLAILDGKPPNRPEPERALEPRPLAPSDARDTTTEPSRRKRVAVLDESRVFGRGTNEQPLFEPGEQFGDYA